MLQSGMYRTDSVSGEGVDRNSFYGRMAFLSSFSIENCPIGHGKRKQVPSLLRLSLSTCMNLQVSWCGAVKYLPHEPVNIRHSAITHKIALQEIVKQV